MTTPIRGSFRNIRIVASSSKLISLRREDISPSDETLMPYEAAAKAIFIRANGAAAYYKATGLSAAANDPGSGALRTN